MTATDHGPHVLARIVAGVAVDAHDLDTLDEPWRGLARSVLPAGDPAARLAALKAALADQPDRATIVAALSAAN
nr:hypothetical protein [Chloroflexota bacterium]